tara:strand:+ start:4531 stop:6627 length:2097 start_codon:yes stop_codon:yes gene_type:complete
LPIALVSQQKRIGNQEFFQESGTWYQRTSNGENFKVDMGTVSIKFKSDQVQKIAEKYNLVEIRKSSAGYYDFRIPQKSSFFEIIESLFREPAIESIDVNTFGEYHFVPNDSQFSSQWYLNKIGMTSAWNKTKGNSCIQVAIIDSGLEISHEDIGQGSDSYNNLWQNLGEDTWSNPNDPTTGNGIDDDGNGLIDDWRGWDYENANNDVRSTNYHGTHVSGIVSAKLNNTTGISGIGGGGGSNGVELMSIGVGTAEPIGAVIDDAILYAVQNGADVIQLSLSVIQTSAINNAIQTAVNNGIPVICSSGNDYGSVDYPASNTNVIAVGATDQSDDKSSYSNYGPEVFISAPGDNIYSTRLANSYGSGNGTSFAAPQVSAVVALIRGLNPVLTVQEIKDILKNTADKVSTVNYNWNINDPGHSQELGYGRLNAAAAIAVANPIITGPSSFCSSGIFTVNNLPTGTPISWSVTPSQNTSTSVNGNSITVTRLNNAVGSVFITASITGSNGCTRQIEFESFMGVPRPIAYDDFGQEIIFVNACVDVHKNITFTTPPNASQWQWTKISGNFNLQSSNNSGTIIGFQPTTGLIEVKYYSSACNEWSVAALLYVNISSSCGGGFELFSVYPNPASSELTIDITESDGALDDSYQVELVSQSSLKKVYSKKSYDKKLRIPLDNFKEGVYFINILYKEAVIRKQIIIKR